MTIAFNLSQLANYVNTSGKLDASTGLVNATVVANGGTGAATLAANNVLLGNGTAALQTVAPGTNGNVLVSNGSTWQSGSPSSVGATGQVFVGSGTFTVPAGVTKIKVQICGGGGGGGGFGGAGGTGQTSTFGSVLTATGGTGGTLTSGGAGGTGGTGTGGDINLTGGFGSSYNSVYATSLMACGGGVGTNNAYLVPATGLLGGMGGYSDNATVATAGTGYGNGGGGLWGYGGGGGAGGYCLKFITGLTPGATISVTIGNGGTAGAGGTYPGGAGAAGSGGICIVEW